MIIWGLKKKIIEKGDIQTIECPQCKNRVFTLNGFLRYLHIFWIPLLTVQKKATALCSSCSYEFNKKNLPSSIYKELKGNVFSPKHSVLYNIGFLSIGTIVMTFALYVVSLM